MSLKIRLQRGGSNHNPQYRLVVAESSHRRDGRFVEILGTYDPRNKLEDRQLLVKLERFDYWVSVGAQPSDTVRTLVNRLRRRLGVSAPAKGTPTATAESVAAPVF